MQTLIGSHIVCPFKLLLDHGLHSSELLSQQKLVLPGLSGQLDPI